MRSTDATPYSFEQPDAVTFVRDALRDLGVRRFVLGVHASAFPPGELDAGFGAPLSSAGERLLSFAAKLGFNAIQLGPSGQISTINLSPYDGTVFARNPWSLDLASLTGPEFAELLPLDVARRLARGAAGDNRVDPPRVARNIRDALDVCQVQFRELRAREPDHALVHAFETFRAEHAPWLEVNAVYEAISDRTVDDPSRFDTAMRSLFEPGPVGLQRRAAVRATLSDAIERIELAQFLCHAQHAAFRARARNYGIAVWGDMQVGVSHRDRFLHPDCFAADWRVGAPPSRTNPHGQPWGYPLLDPDQLEQPDSPARRLFDLRVQKLMAEHDGVRIDHPHGLVCPWIYTAKDPDPHHAVRHGARAFDSPDSHDPDLQRWAIAKVSDLDLSARSKFADNRVGHLEPEQIARYSRLFDVLASFVQSGSTRDVFAAEVLSTCPFPLRCVLERHGLGRFRVTQKANPDDEHDPYRTEHAAREDWLMLGTHDTPPIHPLAAHWLQDGSAKRRAAYLAARLIEDATEREAAARSFASDERSLLRASLADLFASRAENVYVFVGDLFGDDAPFNRAGVVHPDNWAARLPADFEARYAQRLQEGRALDIAGALELALARKITARES